MESYGNYREILTISDPPKYGVVIEQQQKMSDSSVCRTLYSAALQNVIDIINANRNKDKQREELFNTVIAFEGKRGTGKSSAMYSFAYMLGRNKIADEGFVLGGDVLENVHFHVLKPIDTAQLGVKETIIGRISAALYEQYETQCKQNSQSISTEKKREFIKALSDVNRYAVMYQTGEWFQNSESLLNDTRHISMLRDEMSHLVHTYLRLASGNDIAKNEYLVISIDDLDMGIQNSYAVMEEIRKFLCIHHVIVLVTLRMDQIHLALKAEFGEKLKKEPDRRESKAMIDDLAYRYAEKLFPHNRQHQMPTLSLEQLKTWKADFSIDGFQNNYILQTTLHLIWRKTWLLPACNSDKDHLLVPRNLRSLCNFVIFLRELPDVVNIEQVTYESDRIFAPEIKDKSVLKENLRRFSQYLVVNVRSYEQEYLSDEDLRFAEKLIAVIHNMDFIPLERLNSRIVGDILYFLKNEDRGYYCKLFSFAPNSENDNTPNELEILLSACMHPETVSFGDLMYVLGKIDNKTMCRYIRYLVEVIRTLWSVRMMEALCREESEISSALSCGIGKLIVNPDVGFFGKQSDLKPIDGNEIKGKMSAFSVCRNENGDKSKWREMRETRAGKEKVYWHPLGPLTKQARELQIPSYSFDYMYRFYELLHEAVEETEDSAMKAEQLYGSGELVLKTMDALREEFNALGCNLQKPEDGIYKEYAEAAKNFLTDGQKYSQEQLRTRIDDAKSAENLATIVRELLEDKYNISLNQGDKTNLTRILTAREEENVSIELDEVKSKLREIIK